MRAHSRLFHLGMSSDVNKRVALIGRLHQQRAGLVSVGSAIYSREGQLDKRGRSKITIQKKKEPWEIKVLSYDVSPIITVCECRGMPRKLCNSGAISL